MFTELNAYPKSQQLYSKRVKLTQRQMGDISAKVRKEVNTRSQDFCEGCGKHKLRCWTLENAHIESRGSIGHKTTANDLLRLCGPSTQSGTCHHFVESSKQGKQYLLDQRERLLSGEEPLKINEWRMNDDQSKRNGSSKCKL